MPFAQTLMHVSFSNPVHPCCSLFVEARDRRRRLLSLVLSAPQRAERYFNASPLRRWMWAGISVCNGFYAGMRAGHGARSNFSPGFVRLQRRPLCLQTGCLLYSGPPPRAPLPPCPGNIATLSFGALAVNDVFAAVVTLLFCEVVTHLHYTDTTGSLTLWYLNCFKMGLIASLLADAIKLGS